MSPKRPKDDNVIYIWMVPKKAREPNSKERIERFYLIFDQSYNLE